MTQTEATSAQPQVTKTGIPIRNLWHMMLYVWDALHVKNQWRAEIENAPSLDALLSSVLSELIQQRLRIGLGRDYRKDEAEIAGIRGRVAFGECIKRMSFPHGRAYCRFQTFSPNVTKNQIVRSTLARLVQLGDFGPIRSKAAELRSKLRRIIREIDVADLIELKPNTVRREQLKRHDADYALMLAICHLVIERQMPTEFIGDEKSPVLDRDSLILWRLFERFVAKFYKAHLKSWRVYAQQRLEWPADITSEYLPILQPDISLKHRKTKTRVVIDTKFTAKSLVPGRWGKLIFNRNHLFQMYAYLRSQEHFSGFHRNATGILLYPTVKYCLSDVVKIQGHNIRWETVDLAKPWMDIENDLLAIPLKALASYTEEDGLRTE